MYYIVVKCNLITHTCALLLNKYIVIYSTFGTHSGFKMISNIWN
jgi:hypothetical protein